MSQNEEVILGELHPDLEPGTLLYIINTYRGNRKARNIIIFDKYSTSPDPEDKHISGQKKH